MHEMMERLDVDSVTLARLRGGDAYAEARTRCLFCKTSDACLRWLDQPVKVGVKEVTVNPRVVMLPLVPVMVGLVEVASVAPNLSNVLKAAANAVIDLAPLFETFDAMPAPAALTAAARRARETRALPG